MGDPRVETITKRLKAIGKECKDLVEILEPEIMSYEIISADVRRKREELKELEGKKDLVKMEIEESEKKAQAIIDVGNERAAAIIESAKKVSFERLNVTDRLLKAVEQFVTERDRERYNKLLEEQSEAREKVA